MNRIANHVLTVVAIVVWLAVSTLAVCVVSEVSYPVKATSYTIGY